MHRRAAGTRSKDSFQIKTLRKPFLLHLVDTHPQVSCYNRGGGWRIGMWPRQNFCAYLDTRGFLIKSVVLPALIKTEHLRECSASRVLALYASAPNHCLWSNVGFAWLLCFGALRSALPAKVAPGELLRLCPGSSGRAP